MTNEPSDTYGFMGCVEADGTLILSDSMGGGIRIEHTDSEDMEQQIADYIQGQAFEIAEAIMDELQPGPTITLDRP